MQGATRFERHPGRLISENRRCVSLTVFAVPTIPAISAALALGRLMQVSEMKGIEDAYRYRMYDTNLDDYLYSTRYATMVKINRIGGRTYLSGHQDQ